ncbi:hypothetical protein Sviol_50010 [Streptomyces violascens]|uniref:Uncharacterized protein n=1 Tax=Streptomyces violascens TaxID=67381 RepID=A0ABQ3QTJ6_9ACTN|nr:hypothetical protein Sviol_50010 [Streptomyces violascens]
MLPDAGFAAPAQARWAHSGEIRPAGSRQPRPRDWGALFLSGDQARTSYSRSRDSAARDQDLHA